MAVAKFFSVLDASTGVWEISLDTESSKIFTLNTPFSLSKTTFWNTLSSFHHTVSRCGVTEHQQQLRKVLDIVRTNNLKMNKDKHLFQTTGMTYLVRK